MANAWLKLDQPELVLETLIADPRLRDNFEAVTLALSRSAEVPDPKQVLDFVGEDVNRRFSLPVSSKLDLAVLMRLCGAPDQAGTDSLPEFASRRKICRSWQRLVI